MFGIFQTLGKAQPYTIDLVPLPSSHIVYSLDQAEEDHTITSQAILSLFPTPSCFARIRLGGILLDLSWLSTVDADNSREAESETEWTRSIYSYALLEVLRISAYSVRGAFAWFQLRGVSILQGKMCVQAVGCF